MEEEFEILEKALKNLEATESNEKENASNFEGLYKNWGTKFQNQEERRKKLLEFQKSKRNNKIDRFRGILDLNAVDETKLFKHKKASYKPTTQVAGFHKTCLTYSNVLMLSEWMVEKPSDFSQNWYVVPCPKGIRLLVIANRGTTKFYTKKGHFKFECHTGLPGGNPRNFYRKSCCILDGFYNETTNTLYLLDILAWNNQPMTDGETEFRQYWMKTQLEDFPDTTTINKKNEIIINILPMMPCTNHFLSYLLSQYPYFENNLPPLDGLLFYHRRAHYVAGETPLVGWLFPYMIPEILGEDISIHPSYMNEMPTDYVNQADFILKFEARYAEKRCISGNVKMETGCNNSEKINDGNILANAMEAETDEKTDPEKICDKEDNGLAID